MTRAKKLRGGVHLEDPRVALRVEDDVAAVQRPPEAIAAVRRRYDPEWGPLARGAVTDPTRFLGYTPREDSSDADEDATYMGRSTRSFWDSARGQAMLGGTPDEPITTPRRKEMLASQKRRMWIMSSRRWVENMKAKGPMAPEERKKAQGRLYTQSARAGVKPRVYC